MVLTNTFFRTITCAVWVVTPIDIYVSDFRDSIAGSDTFYLGIHKHATTQISTVLVNHPPSPLVKPLDSFIHATFNRRKFAISPSWPNPEFSDSGLSSSNPIFDATPAKHTQSQLIYNKHISFDDKTITAGSWICDVNGICHPVGNPSTHMFQSNIGIKFNFSSDNFIRFFSS